MVERQNRGDYLGENGRLVDEQQMEFRELVRYMSFAWIEGLSMQRDGTGSDEKNVVRSWKGVNE